MKTFLVVVENIHTNHRYYWIIKSEREKVAQGRALHETMCKVWDCYPMDFYGRNPLNYRFYETKDITNEDVYYVTAN